MKKLTRNGLRDFLWRSILPSIGWTIPSTTKRDPKFEGSSKSCWTQRCHILQHGLGYPMWTRMVTSARVYQRPQGTPIAALRNFIVLCGFMWIQGHDRILNLYPCARCQFRQWSSRDSIARGCVQEHIDIVHVLLNHGADINANGPMGCPLISACDGGHGGGHVEIVRLLLEHGASVDEWNGHGALSIASSTRNVEAVQLLLQYSVDINFADGGGWTALHWAAFWPEIIELLLEYGLTSMHGTWPTQRPCTNASRKGILESVQTLLRHGADVCIRGEHD